MSPARMASGNVIPLRPKLDDGIQASRLPSAFDELTARLIIAQHRNGTLQEGLLLALLAAATGLRP
jgi:hypothetical protein